jgi:membrane protease YdiL (CAAX protease family)
MLICAGEGVELDTQRRRHPMWEWLFSHPVYPGPVFLAEMLSPIAANPIYCTAPVFAGILYGGVYGWGLGIVATFIIGIPLTLAAACLGKAIEIAIMLRFPARNRGAAIGLMSLFGYSSQMLIFLGGTTAKKFVPVVAEPLAPLTRIPWPWLGMFLGQRPDGAFSFALGLITTWVVAAVIATGSVAFAIWGAKQGLVSSSNQIAPARGPSGQTRFARDPLYRKELLWFRRDRSAIVQVLLLPVTLAGFQLIGLHWLVGETSSAWNYVCGAGILVGTYILTVLGPGSLASEGSALWLALTWPRGLEDLLKAKARLWTLISSAIVGLVLCYAAFLYPESGWKIALLAVGWYPFARSMAEKMVTLATVTSESGERQRVPMGRHWATTMGTLTFAIGVLTQQWTIAVAGIVYSVMTAAAMWQNFRARLPYLYDPWSETLPTPPTLMHAMIAISCLVESAALITGGLLPFVGRANIAALQAFAYAASAILVSVLMVRFLQSRGVPLSQAWKWPREVGSSWLSRSELLSVAVGAAAGLVLGFAGRGYLALMHRLPLTADLLNQAERQVAAIPNLHLSLFVMGVFFAPVAEEYLFRDLLYRALERHWGGWRAVAGSAAFFAIYHPALSWLPVGLLGAANALLYKKTGRLAPAILLHMVYNAVVLS